MRHRTGSPGRHPVAVLLLSAVGVAASAAAQAASPDAVEGFIHSHAAVSEWTQQVGRWYQTVCPKVSGLQPEFSRSVSQRIETVAQEVGAPTAAPGAACDVNIEITFTPYPQLLLDRIAEHYRALLGFFYEAQWTEVTTIRRPLQAWYVTGTQSLESPTLLHPLLNGDRGEGASGPGPVRIADSRLNQRLRSEILRVTVIADANALTRYPLPAIADYIALLSLTRMASANGCAALPSIVDLLSRNCERGTAPVTALTAADLALLKALYSADLEARLNLEQSDLKARMLSQLSGT